MLIEWKITDIEGKVKAQGNHDFVPGVNRIIADAGSFTAGTVRAEIRMRAGAREKIFMNGYQTWTTCREYAPYARIRGLNGLPSALIDYYSFDRYGDYHFIDYSNSHGKLHGFSYCYIRRGEHFRLVGSLDETNGYTIFRYDDSESRMLIERDCRGLKIDGRFHLFDLYYNIGSEQDVFDGWFDAMNVRCRTDQKLFGYSSWYNRYQNISEKAILKDLGGCREIFEEGDLFQIDDGWEPYIGDWLEADHVKFPDGMKKMADEIHSCGFRAGIWLAPFVAEENSKMFHEHPDWFLKVDGKPWKAGCNWSGFYPLDIDLPEVQDHLRKVFDRVLNEWNYDLVKLDFLYAAAPYGNEKETRAGRMIRAMKFLRELCGDKLILGCGVPVMTAFGIVDYCRVSCDVSLDWNDKPHMRIIHRERPSTKNAVTNVIYRRQLNGRAYLSDPDVFFLRSSNISLTDKQKDNLAKLDALLGGVFLTSDDPSAYTEKMKEQYRFYRHMTEAENVEVNASRTGTYVSWTLDGKEHGEYLF